MDIILVCLPKLLSWKFLFWTIEIFRRKLVFAIKSLRLYNYIQVNNRTRHDIYAKLKGNYSNIWQHFFVEILLCIYCDAGKIFYLHDQELKVISLSISTFINNQA